MSKPPADLTPVLLATHTEDTLSVFMRDRRGDLHQAAKFVTHNGVEAAAMAAIVADLSDVFGWEGIVAPRAAAATRQQAALPPARAGTAVPARAQSHPAGKGKRRGGTPGRNTRHAVTMEQVIEFVAQHPEGTKVKAIADALMPGDKERYHTVSNRLIAYRDRCAKTGEPSRIAHVKTGVNNLTLYPREP